jgi:26S proteasome regulatory subunit T4
MDIAEILKKVDEERYIVKVSARYEVNVSDKVDKSKLVVGARVALDKLTQTIVRILPREVDPMIYSMLNEDPGKVSFNDIGGLHDQIRDLRESIELPITNAELF